MDWTGFARYSLVLFSAPLIWAVHFIGIYAFAGVVCARPGLQRDWAGLPLLVWGVLGAGVLALAALALAMRARPGPGAVDSPGFLRQVSAGLAWLVVVAVVWESAAVLFFPGCAVGNG